MSYDEVSRRFSAATSVTEEARSRASVALEAIGLALGSPVGAGPYRIAVVPLLKPRDLGWTGPELVKVFRDAGNAEWAAADAHLRYGPWRAPLTSPAVTHERGVGVTERDRWAGAVDHLGVVAFSWNARRNGSRVDPWEIQLMTARAVSVAALTQQRTQGAASSFVMVDSGSIDEVLSPSGHVRQVMRPTTQSVHEFETAVDGPGAAASIERGSIVIAQRVVDALNGTEHFDGQPEVTTYLQALFGA